MPLLLMDLDNTLVDRDAAFRAAVAAFLAEHGLPAADVDWVMAVDASGYAPRAALAEALNGRYGHVVPAAVVEALLDREAVDRVTLAPATRAALDTARTQGWTRVIITNGCTAQQEAKIRRSGLDRLVEGWVVSEDVGHKKPAPEIFRAAAEAGGVDLPGAWVIGDAAHADIAGAHRLGLHSVWVSNGRSWTEDAFRPTRVATDVATAIGHAIGTYAPDVPETGVR